MIARGVSLLEAFRPREPSLTLAALARRTGLPKPTVHRLANELVTLGLLQRNEGGYELGLLVFELGQRATRTAGLHDVALPYLGRLLEATRQVVNLAVLDGSDIVYVDRLRSRSDARLESTVGGRMPAHCTALGKVLLAHSAPTVVDRVVADGLAPRGPHTITSPEALRGELARVARDRVAYDIGESTASSLCVAAPVLDYQNNAVAAISVTGLPNEAALRAIGRTVREVGSALSRQYTVRWLANAARAAS